MNGPAVRNIGYCLPSWAFIDKEPNMGIRERAVARRGRIVAHRATSFEDAEKWDLDFWQSQTPEQRLSALVAIRKDVAKVQKCRLQSDKTGDERN